jgi:hypothetical protein
LTAIIAKEKEKNKYEKRREGERQKKERNIKEEKMVLCLPQEAGGMDKHNVAIRKRRATAGSKHNKTC